MKHYVSSIIWFGSVYGSVQGAGLLRQHLGWKTGIFFEVIYSQGSNEMPVLSHVGFIVPKPNAKQTPTSSGFRNGSPIM